MSGMSWNQLMAMVNEGMKTGTQMGLETVKNVANCLTAKQALPNTRLDGKVAIVTGANSGIGKETAKELAKRGAKVILACRDEIKGREVANELQTIGKVSLKKLDLASFKSVKEFCKIIQKEEKSIDILVNNAGVFSLDRTITEDGHELQFQVNHLSHFLLTNLLMDQLKSKDGARIVNVSSVAHWISFGIPSDLQWENTSYNGILAYAHSKLANVMFSSELARKLKGSNVSVYSLHPGGVASNLGRNIPNYLPDRLTNAISLAVNYIAKTPEEGAMTSLYCCLAPNLPSGYYDNMKLGWISIVAGNSDLNEELWDLSEDLTKLPFKKF